MESNWYNYSYDFLENIMESLLFYYHNHLKIIGENCQGHQDSHLENEGWKEKIQAKGFP